MTTVRNGLHQRRRIGLWAALIAIAVGLVVALPATASHPEVSLPGSNFEIDTDANLKVDDPAPSIDWASVTEQRKADVASGAGDDSFGQGSQGGHARPDRRGRQHPEQQERPAQLRRLPRRERHGSLPQHVLAPGAGAARDDEHGLRVQQVQDHLGQRRHAGTHVRRCADPVRLGVGRQHPELFASRWIDGSEGATAADCEANNALPCWKRARQPDRGWRRSRVDQHVGHPRSGVRRARRYLARTFGEAQVNLTALDGSHSGVRHLRQRLPQEPLVRLVQLGAEGLHRSADAGHRPVRARSSSARSPIRRPIRLRCGSGTRRRSTPTRRSRTRSRSATDSSSGTTTCCSAPATRWSRT